MKVWAGRVNLSCWQLQQGQAIYKLANGGLAGPIWEFL